jgi:hypothetical protein
VEVQSVFNFLDWRSKLALARCNRALLGDCDSPMAWQDSDGPSAFSAAGVIELNLARLTDEPTIERAATRTLAGRRGRVRLLYRHRTPKDSACSRFIRLPVGTFRRTAASLPRLHGLGPLCSGCSSLEEWTLLLTVASEVKCPLAELRVDNFYHPLDDLTSVVSARAVQMACSPAVAPHLRALAFPWAWSPTDDDAPFSRRETQLECSSELWVYLVELQPHSALYRRLRSLSILCQSTSLGSMCQSLCSSQLEQLRVLRLHGWLRLPSSAASASHQHWDLLLPALPRLETLALLLHSGDQSNDALSCLFPAAAPAHPSLRTLQLLLRAKPGHNPSRVVVKQTLAHCPQLRLELNLEPLPDDLRASWWDPDWRSLQRVRLLWEWCGLPRTTWPNIWPP